MYELISAIKGVIDERVVSRRSLREPASAGSSTIHVNKAIHYSPCDCIAIIEGDCTELHTIDVVSDGLTLTLSEPLSKSFTTAATIEKTYQSQLVQTFLGDPPIHQFPAITIDLEERSDKPLAIGMSEQTFTLPIKIYVSKEDFETSYKLMHQLVEKTEKMLYTVPNPLINPYVYSTLTANIDWFTTHLEVEHPELFGEQVDIVLDSASSQTNHRIGTKNSDNSFELITETDVSYQAGDTIIRPLMKIYDPALNSITYSDAMQNETNLKIATLNYSCKVARLRGVR